MICHAIIIAIAVKVLNNLKTLSFGSSGQGYDERELYAYSTDKMAFKNIYLVSIEGQVYIEAGSQGNYLFGYPLPDELNQYITDTVFVE